jgi:hypothetical protein
VAHTGQATIRLSEVCVAIIFPIGRGNRPKL